MKKIYILKEKDEYEDEYGCILSLAVFFLVLIGGFYFLIHILPDIISALVDILSDIIIALVDILSDIISALVDILSDIIIALGFGIVTTGSLFFSLATLLFSLGAFIIYARAFLRTFARGGTAFTVKMQMSVWNLFFSFSFILGALIYLDIVYLGLEIVMGIGGAFFQEQMMNIVEPIKHIVYQFALNREALVLADTILQSGSAFLMNIPYDIWLYQVLFSIAVKITLLIPCLICARGLSSSVGDSRNPPRQPARLSYFYRQVRMDYYAVISDIAVDFAYINSICAKLSRGDYSWISWPPLLIWFFLTTYCAFFIVAAIAFVAALIFSAIYFIILLIVLLISSILALLFFGIEQAVILSRAGYAKCPHAKCHKPVPLPMFGCPKCGEKHDRLLPGRFGMLVRTCKCGKGRLPTLFWLGKGRLESFCPACKKPMNKALFSGNAHIPIYGSVSMFLIVVVGVFYFAGISADLLPDFPFDRVEKYASGVVQEEPYRDSRRHDQHAVAVGIDRAETPTVSLEQTGELARNLQDQEDTSDEKSQVLQDHSTRVARVPMTKDLENQLCPVGTVGECYTKLDSPRMCYLWLGKFWHKDEEKAIAWSGACNGGLARGTGTISWEGGRNPSGQATGTIEKGRLQGQWVFRYANGTIHEGPFLGGKLHGQWVLRDTYGTVQEGLYVDGQKHGQWVFRNAYGVAFKTEEYRSGKLVQ